MNLMRIAGGVGTIAVLAAFAGCGSEPASEPTGTTASAQRAYARGGFSSFGGKGGLCLSSVGATSVAGAGLVSVTCDGFMLTQGWTLTPGFLAGYVQIHAQENPGLCIDVASATPLLAACDSSSWTQEVNLGGGSMNIPAQGSPASLCLDTVGESAASGAAVDYVPCTTSPSQGFWAWGFPLGICSSEGDCLYNATFGQPLVMQSMQGRPGEKFTGAPGGQIVQFNPDVGLTTQGTPYGEDQCLTVDGLSWTSSTLSVEPCVAGGTPSQIWSQTITVSDATARGNGLFQLSSEETGFIIIRGRFLRPAECIQDDGTLQECSGGTAQQLFANYLE